MNSNNNKVARCQNCGALATTEICEYCKGASGIDKKFIKLEYPIAECKETNVTFKNVVEPIILGSGFILVAVLSIICTMQVIVIEGILFSMLMAFIGIIFINHGLTPIIRIIKVKKYGEEKEAIVYGYMKDEYIINGYPTQIVKLLIDTKYGKKFILYKLEKNKQPYKIKGKVKLKVYKDIYQILEKQRYYFE